MLFCARRIDFSHTLPLGHRVGVKRCKYDKKKYVNISSCLEASSSGIFKLVSRAPAWAESALTKLTKVTRVQMGYPTRSAGNWPKNSCWFHASEKPQQVADPLNYLNTRCIKAVNFICYAQIFLQPKKTLQPSLQAALWSGSEQRHGSF